MEEVKAEAVQSAQLLVNAENGFDWKVALRDLNGEIDHAKVLETSGFITPDERLYLTPDIY